MPPALVRAALLGSLLIGCGDTHPPSPPTPEVAARPQPEPAPPPTSEVVCPADGVASHPLPRTRPEHEQLDYWLARTSQVADLDRPLFTAKQLEAHNARLRQREVFGASARSDLLAPVDAGRLADDLNQRLAYLQTKFDTSAYVAPDGAPLPAEQRAALAPSLTAADFAALPEPELRVALDLVPIYCAPRRDPYYTLSRDPAFNRNLCSMARPQELVQILRPWAEGLALARTTYVMGWIDVAAASFSPPLAAADARRFMDGPYARAGRDLVAITEGGVEVSVPFAALLPAGKRRGEVLLATAGGVVTARPRDPASLAAAGRPLTRRAALAEAFAYLHTPYGWGDYQGGRDCSRFLMDMFGGLGLLLPRHTSDQALAGAEVIELAPDLPEDERLLQLDAAHRRGLVLLHFPGHIMLYLGRDEADVPMAIHSFAEYLVPCPGRAAEAPAGERETLLKVDGVHVSDLELGRGTSRRAFIQRITKVTVLAPPSPT